MAANVIKSVIFNGKVSYRIVRADAVGDEKEKEGVIFKNEDVH